MSTTRTDAERLDAAGKPALTTAMPSSNEPDIESTALECADLLQQIGAVLRGIAMATADGDGNTLSPAELDEESARSTAHGLAHAGQHVVERLVELLDVFHEHKCAVRTGAHQ